MQNIHSHKQKNHTGALFRENHYIFQNLQNFFIYNFVTQNVKKLCAR